MPKALSDARNWASQCDFCIHHIQTVAPRCSSYKLCPLYLLLPSRMADSATMPKTGTKPVKVFRDRRISVSVFPRNVTVRDKEMTLHSVSVERSYKDGEVTKWTHNLDKDDLPPAQLLMAQAWQWIIEQ